MVESIHTRRAVCCACGAKGVALLARGRSEEWSLRPGGESIYGRRMPSTAKRSERTGPVTYGVVAARQLAAPPLASRPE